MNSSPESNQSPSKNNLWVLSALLTAMAASLLVAAIFIFRVWTTPQGNSSTERSPLTEGEVAALLLQRDRAVAFLENQDFERAEAELLAIIQRVPSDPFGPRNLVICRELWLGKLDPAREQTRHAELLVKAREALERLASIEKNSYVPHVLDARISVHAGEIEKAESSLIRATELAPNRAAVWYDLYSLHPVSPGESPSDTTINALRKTYELDPSNLFVLKDWLPLLAQLKDPAFAETADAAKETLRPFSEIIKTHARVDVLDLLGVVAKAAREDKWPIAIGRSMAIRNVMLSEAARDDRYVKLDSLEYLLQDFDSTFYAQTKPSSQKTNSSNPISFRPRIIDPVSEDSKQTRYLYGADLNLDGRIDGLSLFDSQFVVSLPLLPESNTTTATLIKTSISGDYDRLISIDLDDDVDSNVKPRTGTWSGCQLADPDVILFGPDGIKLFENRLASDGLREFVERPNDEALKTLRNVVRVVPVDLDLDGDLDFLTISREGTESGLRLWSNRSNWSFEEITSRLILPPESFSPTSAVVCDWDHDTDTDVIVSGQTGVGVMENIRHGRFRWRSFDPSFDGLQQATQLLVEDFDGNGSWDLLGVSLDRVTGMLTQSSSGGIVTSKGPIHFPPSLETNSEKNQSDSTLRACDFDNDGRIDLALLNDRLHTWRGDGTGRFENLTESQIETRSKPSSMIIHDFDRDGDIDVAINLAQQTTAYVNDGGNENGWLDVSLLAQQLKPNEQNYSKRVNHFGIGSTIELKAGVRYQKRLVTDAVTHFGLGAQKKADVVRVIWTNGVPRNLIDPEPNLHVCEEQKLVGSCPYLYTWNGSRFEFVTDLLWNSPIGLKFAESVVAPWREWEYLKIDGSKLKPKNGEYLLQITEELWEAGYLDQVKLFAVDHPAGTDIYTNEKVGPAFMADHKIHTVKTPRTPIAARDTSGRNILEHIKARDGVYTKTYDRKLAQGLTTEHFLELDLGPWMTQSEQSGSQDQTNPPKASSKNEASPDESKAQRPNAAPVVMLFLTGWVYPTSTSLNVQFSQNPNGPQPRPPSLHAVDKNGEWREIRPFMGFPGGKTKTIAIDISDVFASDSNDHRLRIATNMEFYWDHVFFTVDDAPVDIKITELSLLRADLHDRGGISFREYDSGNGPEYFHHDRLVSGLHWPPMAGAFTRFGDVKELLSTRDDRLVVLGCNDEATIAFQVPDAPLQEGWIRDFVIYNVGWDKDSDMNTVYGEAVEPLPFEGMTVYAHRDGEPRPTDEAYERYLNKYQTRPQRRPPFWNDVRRWTRQGSKE